jgi:hypothetical protein
MEMWNDAGCDARRNWQRGLRGQRGFFIFVIAEDKTIYYLLQISTKK